jgi:hypothetical protein
MKKLILTLIATLAISSFTQAGPTLPNTGYEASLTAANGNVFLVMDMSHSRCKDKVSVETSNGATLNYDCRSIINAMDPIQEPRTPFAGPMG